jgi:predicted DsbA family dithiol-disulfide isomerase
MKIEIWSDIACPWCYLGKHRFEEALAQFEGRDDVDVTYRSFQLDPTAPSVAQGSLNELLSKKFGMPLAQAEAMNARMTAMGEPEGIAFHFDRARPANTFDAHRLVHLANENGKGAAMKERLFQAYFRDGLVVSDPDTLAELADEEGLDARPMLASAEYADDVRADIERARDLGISGVPFFVFDEKYGVSGAQTADVLVATLREVATES